MEEFNMQRVFVGDEGFPEVLERSRAKGHTRLKLDGISPFSCVDIKTDGTDLVVFPVEEDENEKKIYTVLCKEFGLVGRKSKFKSKVSVIFCDNGYMLVTLHSGGIVINLENKIVMPTVGTDTVPEFSEDEILWVNEDMLLGYSKYMDLKGKFMYDFEFMYNLMGEVANSMSGFTYSRVDDEDVDISLGYVARYEQNMKVKSEAKDAKNLMNICSSNNSSRSFEFDDDDDEDDYDDDYDDEDDYGDY